MQAAQKHLIERVSLAGQRPAFAGKHVQRFGLVQFAPERDIAELEIETLFRRQGRRRIVGLKWIVAHPRQPQRRWPPALAMSAVSASNISRLSPARTPCEAPPVWSRT